MLIAIEYDPCARYFIARLVDAPRAILWENRPFKSARDAYDAAEAEMKRRERAAEATA